MKQVSIQYLEHKAQTLQSSSKKWHFHILTPDCQLNETNQYALILENTTDNKSWVCYSNKPYMGIGKKLVQILHGNNVIQDEKVEKQQKPSPQVEKLLKRAKELTKKGVFWHHHMLFPGCMFNKHKGKFVIVFEDQENNEIIESVSEQEPKSDLQHIEGLFYSQSK